MAQPPKGTYEVIHQPNKLKDLVGGPARMDERLIAKAEAALAEASAKIDLSETAKESIIKLDDAVERLKTEGAAPAGPVAAAYAGPRGVTCAALAARLSVRTAPSVQMSRSTSHCMRCRVVAGPSRS